MGPTDIEKIAGSSCVICTNNAYLNGLDNFSPDGYVTCEQCCNHNTIQVNYIILTKI